MKRNTKSKKSTAVKKKPVVRKTSTSSTQTNKPTKNTTAAQQEMRIAIAKDVLKQLNAKKIIAASGTWITDSKMPDLDEYVCDLQNKGERKFDVKNYVNKVNQCEVCALGSLFVSAVNLYNNVYISTDKNSNPQDQVWNIFTNLSSSPLKRYFSVAQLKYIEAAYEGLAGEHIPADERSEKYAEAFYLAHSNNNERLRGIMQNIIDNNGTFKPETSLVGSKLDSLVMNL